jgi:ECF transporter S component (folate family)
MKKTRILVFLSLLIAMDILLTHIIPVIQWDVVRISFGFVPESFSSMLFGPWIGGISAVLGDMLGMMIAPKGPYFPGFTLSALLTGIIFGLILYKKPKTILRITLAVLCITLFVDLGLNTYWLAVMYGKGYFALLPTRIVRSAVMLPVQIAVISLMWRYAGKHIENMSLQGRGEKKV